MSAHTDAPADEHGRPKNGHLTAFTDDRIFGESMNALDRHTSEIQAVANPHRYAILHYIWDRVDGDLEQRIPRSELVTLSELKEESGGFQQHMKQLLKADLIAEVPAPDGEDGRKTFYRLTYGGQALMDTLSNLHPDPETDK